MVMAIRPTVPAEWRIVASCQPGSAAYNRNVCLSDLDGDVGIMLDDDIEGFYCGWAEQLLDPLEDPLVVMVSARLLRRDGQPGETCSRCRDLVTPRVEIQPAQNCVLPTAAIAFRNLGLRFDEGYRGSGFEDSDWCFQYLALDSRCKFIQSNECRLVHRNEMKSQRDNWAHNRSRFLQKWPGIPGQ